MIKIESKKQFILLWLTVLLSFIVLVSILLLSSRQTESPTKLSSQEQQIPVTPPQPFLHENSQTAPGKLLVFSNPTGARVLIDAPEEEGGGTASLNLPVNLTPMRVESIPAGIHHLFITKEGYAFKEMDVEIKSGEVTRITVDLEAEVLPQPPTVDWQSKLPINQVNYSVSYSPTTGIIVTMRLTSENPQEAQEEAQNLSDQIRNELELIGVPTTSEKITWRVE
jgi:hypothetical protein